MLLPLAAIPFFFCKTKEKCVSTLWSELILLLALGVGFLSLFLQLKRFSDLPKYTGEQVVVGTVTEMRENGDKTRLTLSNVTIGGEQVEGKLNAYLPTPYCEKLQRTDVILINGRVETDTSYENDYGIRSGEISERIPYVFWGDSKIAVIGKSTDFLLNLHLEFERSVLTGMSEEVGSVVLGILFGNTESMDDALMKNIRFGGIAHVFAVSGLHVGVLYGFFAWLFEKTGLKNTPKWLRFLLVAVVLIFYAGICGFGASVLRAVIMCLVAYAAKLTELPKDMLETLGIAAILVLLLNPVALFGIGFQLSFLAVLGIAFLRKPIGQVCDELTFLFIKRPENGLEKNSPIGFWEKLRRDFVGLVSVSVSTQLATAPVLLDAFGYLSGWSLLLNMLFVPLIGAVFSLLLLFVVLAAVLPIAIADIVLFIPNAVWSALLLLFDLMDFSSFALSGITVSGSGMLCYYAGCTFLSDKWNIPKWGKIALTVLLFVGAAVATVVVNVAR